MKNLLIYFLKPSLMVLFFIFLNSNVYCQDDTVIPNYKVYELEKMDTNFHKIYIYLQFKRDNKTYDVLLVKDTIKINENLKTCPIKLKGKYKLALDGLNYIPYILEGVEFYWPIFQHPLRKGKIGGTYSFVYTTDQLMGIEIDCNLIIEE